MCVGELDVGAGETLKDEVKCVDLDRWLEGNVSLVLRPLSQLLILRARP